MSSVQEEILRNMVGEELQVKKPKAVQTEESVYVQEASRTISTSRLVDVSQPSFQFDSSIENKRFKSLPKTTAQYTRFTFLRNLQRGDIVAIAEWTLRPAHGVVVVSHVTDTLIVSIDGRRFSRKDGTSSDGNRLTLLPMYEKSRYYIVSRIRKRLGVGV